jgi:excisionase family DNA binding protein
MPLLNGKLLKAARRLRDESVDQVGADVGAAGGHIRNIEGGRAPASPELAERLAARFGIPLNDLLDLSTQTAAVTSALPLSDRIAFNVADAAQAIGVKKRTILAAIKAGDLKAGWIGQAYVIPRAELEAFVERSMKNRALPRSA